MLAPTQIPTHPTIDPDRPDIKNRSVPSKNRSVCSINSGGRKHCAPTGFTHYVPSHPITMVTLLENPLRLGLQQQRLPEPTVVVFFGASGDLTKRKLVPALYKLKRERKLPPELTIVGVARREWNRENIKKRKNRKKAQERKKKKKQSYQKKQRRNKKQKNKKK